MNIHIYLSLQKFTCDFFYGFWKGCWGPVFPKGSSDKLILLSKSWGNPFYLTLISIFMHSLSAYERDSQLLFWYSFHSAFHFILSTRISFQRIFHLNPRAYFIHISQPAFNFWHLLLAYLIGNSPCLHAYLGANLGANSDVLVMQVNQSGAILGAKGPSQKTIIRHWWEAIDCYWVYFC